MGSKCCSSGSEMPIFRAYSCNSEVEECVFRSSISSQYYIMLYNIINHIEIFCGADRCLRATWINILWLWVPLVIHGSSPRCLTHRLSPVSLGSLRSSKTSLKTFWAEDEERSCSSWLFSSWLPASPPQLMPPAPSLDHWRWQACQTHLLPANEAFPSNPGDRQVHGSSLRSFAGAPSMRTLLLCASYLLVDFYLLHVLSFWQQIFH